MNPIPNRRRRQARPPVAAQVHVPHWSWTRKDSPPAEAPLAPEEFWSRLGL